MNEKHLHLNDRALQGLRPTGRPRSLDSERKRLVLIALARGANFAEAALAAACNRDTLLAERKRDSQFDAAVEMVRQWRAVQFTVVLPQPVASPWRSAARIADYQHELRRQARERGRFENLLNRMEFEAPPTNPKI